MNIKGKILEIEKEQSALNQKLELLKVEYKQYITNKEIPVLERWSFFINAPSQLKNKTNWIIRPNTTFMRYVMDNWFDAPEVYGRGKQVIIGEMFEDLVGKDEIYIDNYDFDDIDEDDIKEGLEELLEMNIESFCIDW